MKQPWEPELIVDETLARRLVTAQFPDLADAPVRRIGGGWDNAAYLVAEHLVFRFPQRAIAGPLMPKELALLPLIAAQLPLPIPLPCYAGEPSAQYPWHFGGYELVAGVPGDARVFTRDERAALARDLGRFLKVLHAIDPQPLLGAGLPHDTIGRLDPDRIGIDEPALEGTRRVVHGDLYERHLLFDSHARLCGIIDWGDVHYGLAAVDLSVVHMMIPEDLHDEFFAAYGEVDARAWRFARARARHHEAMRARAAAARANAP